MNVSVFGERMTKLQAYGFDAADLNDAVRSATDRGDDQKNPSGWLEQFRRVRNLPMHENTAARHYDVLVGTEATVGLSVAGVSRQPVEYLQEMRQRVHTYRTSVGQVEGVESGKAG